MKKIVLLYLSLPLLIFWWGWFVWWVALPCSLGLLLLLSVIFRHLPPWTASFTISKSCLFIVAIAFMWAYLAGIGGFRPQHFDYFKHNLLLNNLIRFDWPVRYADGTYLCYYHAYYLPAALLAKCWGGTIIAPYYIFGWTWLGLTLLFLLLNQLSGWKFVVFFLFFNSIEALLLLYDMLKSDHSLGFLMKDFWTNDHTIELLQTPGGLMFPSHVASFSAAPQHSLPAWLITAFFIPQNTDKTEPFHLQNRLLPWFLLILCLYWSPLVAIGVVPLATRYSVLATRYSALATRYSALATRYSALAMLTLTLLAIPCLIFYAGHLPINELHGWWWEFLTTPHEYALLFTFLTIEVVFWAVIVWFLEKKYQVLEKDKSLIGLALGILFVLTFYRYGHYNDLARRACLPATLILCWGVYRLGSSIPWQTYHFFLLGLVVILPLKDHLRWLTKQPYSIVVDKNSKDFTPYTIHYLRKYHNDNFDVVAQYLGKAEAGYLKYFTPTTTSIPRQTTRAFYYWKSVFKLSKYERKILKDQQITQLYIKFFDVDWDNTTQQAVPKAVIQFKEKPPLAVVPAVFVTNRTLEKLSWGGVEELAQRMVQKITTTAPHLLWKEVQIDCDWTVATKAKYFRLLQQISALLPPSVILSATIRLHQIKFYRTTGIPPVKRGMLMYYNMDDWKNPRTHNSILDLTVAGRYAPYISAYPLALDVVLPVFSWVIVYRNNRPLTFINHLTIKQLQSPVFVQSSPKTNQFIALQDTIVFGIPIRRSDHLRVEESNLQDLKISSQMLSREIQNRRVTFALYHLDSLNLIHYEKDSLRQIFESFR